MNINSFRFQEPYQERLFEKLQMVGDGPAFMYRDACSLMAGPRDLTSNACLVAHLLREINGAIIDSMLPVAWRPEKCPACKHNKDGTYKAKVRSVLGMQGYTWQDADEVAKLWMSLGELHRVAHKDSLSAPRPVDKELEEVFRQAESVFRMAVSTLEASFPSVQQKLDHLLSLNAPTSRDATTLRTRVPNSPVVLRYFFDRAGAEWLEPLKEKHFFEHPPETVHDEERGVFYCPPWPQSSYLKRMAATDEAGLVSGIIKNLRQVSNPRVLKDFREAMLAMPPDVAVELVDDAGEWLKAEMLFDLPETLGEVVVKLAANGKTTQAVELARALLALPEGLDAENATRKRRFPSSLDEYRYEKILEEHIPTLVHHAGIAALEMLCDLLDSLLRIAFPDSAAEGDFEDHSSIWHDRIEEDGKPYSRDLKSLLTVSVRRSAEQLLSENVASVVDLVRVLERRKWVVFRRIALHVLRLSPKPAVDLISTRLADRHLFDDPLILHLGLGRDYGLLLQRWYSILPACQKSEILTWIEQGPDVEQWMKSYEHSFRKTPSATTVRGHTERWQLDRLSLIKDHLPEDWQKRYQALEKKHREDKSDRTPGFPWVRPRPLLAADQMKAMDVRDLVKQLESLTPARSIHAPDDIAHELGNAVAAEPRRFSDAAEQFSELRPLYAWAFLHGLREAAKREQAIRWRPVLTLCARLLQRAPSDTESLDEDEKREWAWICKTIAELIRAGITSEQGKIPVRMRSAVWALIKRLADEPTREHGGPEPGELSVEDLHRALLNDVRAETLWAAIDYAVWLKKKGKGDRLEAMPEALDFLERHVNVQEEESVIVHSMYGLLLSSLLWLDEGWVAEQVDQIFPTEPQRSPLFISAWKLYICGHDAYDRVFELLEPKYLHAAEDMSIGNDDRWYSEDPNAALVTHVLLLYGRGKIPLDTKSGLLALVFAKMPDEWRGSALAFAGEAMSMTEDAPTEVVKRLQLLWEWRYSECKDAQPAAAHYHEMASFGWWWISGKFPEDWALDCLESVLAEVHWAEPDDKVVEKLAELASHDPRRVVRLLAQMFSEGLRDRCPYGIPSVKHAREIIVAARDSGDPEARQIAQQLVSRLRFWDFGGFNDLIDG
ncbi:MAG: hypothetical protein HYX78_10755 [Armatimonadetes bacterium]|nr:hypothetical protein [Armatimonadota bacterium]